MTTIDEPGTPAATQQPQTIEVRRAFSNPKVHPYDELAWESRDIVQTNWKTQEVIFEQRGVEFPESWSETASTIVATKYFRGALGTEAREYSLKQLIDRVVAKYREGAIAGGYMDESNADVFADELTWLLVNQHFSFNSPVWFNVGTPSPQQVSACFILSVDDSMDSILNWYKEEGFIFKGGSGAGLNLSRIRSSKELLSSGGTASGPVSFMRGADASAGTIKSGGACLAPWTQVYTAEAGPVSVESLAASGKDFTTISFNPILGRMQATRARAWKSGFKKLVKLITDKGQFTLSYDHPVMLMSGGYRPVGELTAGVSVRPANITVNARGYHRVGLQDGTKGKESVHRLVAHDVLGLPIAGMEVHHDDRDPSNNAPENLSVHTRADHLRIHAVRDLADGVHPLMQFHGKGNHPAVAGASNGMSAASGNRSESFRSNQIAGMYREGVYRKGQEAAARQRMLNKAYEVTCAGHGIDTFEDYFSGRKAVAGKMGYSAEEQLAKIESRFGSYEAFRDEVRAGNHTVLAVEEMYDSVVYDVEIDNDTPRDKSVRDGHNFMVVSETNDQRGFTGIMISNTRRAAKMVVLDVDHPDIEEFVATKAREEDKIRALRDAGFDMDLGGADIVSVQYQNANNSVSVSDEFMHAVEDGTEFGLRARTTGEVIETVDARELFDKIAQAAWECADPGLHYNDTMNAWHTNPETGRITASNPCSEFVFLDNTSCNLASLNLLKFIRADGTFDTARFVAAVEHVITAMEISIFFGDFPTESITKYSKEHRPLGIGYANLGALLMRKGFAYDSPRGRGLAAAITALMTGVSYRRSAEIAAVVGAYDGYEINRAAHRKVMVKHAAAADLLLGVLSGGDPAGFVDGRVVGADKEASQVAADAAAEWTTGLRLGDAFGWRNAQASVLAPTGTIGFMMDCDTTGIEPDFSLKKFKKLVGGGSLVIVNAQVEPALRALGYEDSTIRGIIDHIDVHETVVDAPGLDPEHYAVFDTAAGEPRSIEPMGHVLMMAACQPFLSGAISKTVNLPQSATVEQIKDVYLQSWKLGLKATAVYRDQCKVGQPLASSKNDEARASNTEPEVKIVERIVEVPRRAKLPPTRTSSTTSFRVGDADGYLIAGRYDDGDMGEMFLKMSKQGSTMAGVMDAFSIAISVGLQYGVPLETYVAKFINQRFEPAGMTDDPDIRMSQSIIDYIFRRLALDHLPFEVRSQYSIYTAAERSQALDNGGVYEPVSVAQDEIGHNEVQVQPTVQRSASEEADLADMRARAGNDLTVLCSSCGGPTVPAGACRICTSCGTSSGCS